jgi:carboxyl-terminal processing protease
MLVRLKVLFLVIGVLSTFQLTADASAPLKKEDVKKIMQQIFDQHVDQKHISSKLIRKSLKVYIDQFDPDRTYFMEAEVQPFLNPSVSGLDTYVKEYEESNFEIYEKLNTAIQMAISRARVNRKQLFDDYQKLFTESLNYKADPNEELTDPDLKITFAKTPQDLLKRQRKQILQFLAGERQRYGDNETTRNPKATLSVLNKNLVNHENQYLYQDEAGNALSASQKENLFALHILKSISSSLDAHTTVYNPTEAYDMKVRLQKGFQGIGVVLKQGAHGEVKIASFVKGGPAETSKQLQVDDQIISIEGQDITRDSFEKVMELLKGKNSSAIKMTVKRTVKDNGQTTDKNFDVQIQRAPITLNEDRVEVDYLPLPNNKGIIGKITLNSFYQGDEGVNSENDVKAAIKKLDEKGDLRGLILDLRENSGGFLMQAVKVAGLFITNGVVVVSKYSNGNERFYRDMDGKISYDGPLIVLTSRATASAAEIVAQALQDYGVALIVGDEQTYGKGTIQTQTVTENNATNYFKVTVGEYYTPSGKTPQINGVKADIVVPSPFNKEHIGEEYLEGALKPGQIEPSFKDSLKDVQESLKPWYMNYYTPTVQKQTNKWRKFIPDLAAKSQARTSSDKGFQAYIEWVDEVGKPRKNGGRIVFNNPDFESKKDYQMSEALNILKDLIDEDSNTRYLGEQQ